MINFSSNNNASSLPAVKPYGQVNSSKPISNKNNSNNQQKQDHNVTSKVLAIAIAAVVTGGIIYAAKKGKIFPSSNKSAAAPSKKAKETTTFASISQPSEKGKSSGILGILSDGITEIGDFFKKNFSGKSEIKALPDILKPGPIEFPKDSGMFLSFEDRKKLYNIRNLGEAKCLVDQSGNKLIYFDIHKDYTHFPRDYSGFRNSRGETPLPYLERDPILENVADDFLRQIKEKDLVAKAKDQDSYLDVFKFLHQYVRKVFPSADQTFYTTNESQFRNKFVPLGEIIRRGDGVCRHRSALTYYLADHLNENGLNFQHQTSSDYHHTNNRFTITINGEQKNIHYDALYDALPSFV